MMRRSPTDNQATLLRQLLAELRRERKIHQADLARSLNKPQSFVSKYEIGERKLDFVEVINICGALNKNPHELIDEFMEITTRLKLK
mgnify:CR=1 FL=1